MEKNTILTANILDVIFDGRNKEYGAYQLRKNYNRRMSLALITTLGIGLLIFAGTAIAHNNDNTPASFINRVEMVMQEIQPEDEVVIPEQPKLETPKIEMPQIETEKFTKFNITDNEKVLEPPAEQSDLAEVLIDIKKAEGIKFDGMVQPPDVIDGSTGIVEVKKKQDDEETIFTKVEIDASFPGGEAAWRKYLERKCNGQVASDHGAPPGKYRVVVQFIVDKTGRISQVKALTNFGFGMEQEAVKVIANGPDWVPAQQNQNKVSAYRSQPITFVVNEE